MTGGVPLPTTTVTILAPPADDDPYERSGVWTPIAAAVPAQVAGVGGASTEVRQEQIDARVLVPPTVPVDRRHRIEDERTGRVYDVIWTARRQGMGFDYVVCGVRHVAGVGD